MMVRDVLTFGFALPIQPGCASICGRGPQALRSVLNDRSHLRDFVLEGTLLGHEDDGVRSLIVQRELDIRSEVSSVRRIALSVIPRRKGNRTLERCCSTDSGRRKGPAVSACATFVDEATYAAAATESGPPRSCASSGMTRRVAMTISLWTLEDGTPAAPW